MNHYSYKNWPTIKYVNGKRYETDDMVATEFPVTIFIQGEEFATIVCTPINIEQLTIGFLASEGVILRYEEVQSLQIDHPRGFVYVDLHKPISLLDMDHSKRFIGSCCGKSRQFYFKSDVQTARTVMSNTKVTPGACIRLMDQLQEKSDIFKMTGGVHQAGLATTDRVITVQSDIGRHNALDKVYGKILQEKINPRDKIIIFSGRISSEALLKVSKMGIGIMLSNAAPTDLALQLAEDLNITAIGFIRNRKFNVYTHPNRIKENE